MILTRVQLTALLCVGTLPCGVERGGGVVRVPQPVPATAAAGQEPQRWGPVSLLHPFDTPLTPLCEARWPFDTLTDTPSDTPLIPL